MKYYFAGGLFSHKDIIGNRLLADEIFRFSCGRWEALLPQNAENQLRDEPKEIRDNDFEMVLRSDAALFNFDGTELDSGTVAEFMAARFIDLPCVLFRSDFRSAGDQNADGENWNLMLSGYPRSVTVHFECMEQYQRFFKSGNPPDEALKLYYQEMARKVVDALERSAAAKPVLSAAEREKALEIFRKCCGVKS